MSANYRSRIPGLYRYLAPVYGSLRPFWTKTSNRGAERYLEELLATIIRPETVILDLGCGPACNLDRLRRLNLPFARYVGLDLSPAMLTARKSAMPDAASFVWGDAHRLPFVSDSFDAIISTWMFSHLPAPLKVVQEARRLLRPGGWLVAACFAQPHGLPGVALRVVEPLFLMRCVLWQEIQSWPGLVEAKRFLGGANVVVCLREDVVTTDKQAV